jgi:formylglycine-generating enzyme required for sulfatase activity
MEWVVDCWNETYQDGPSDDWMRIAGRCDVHVRRGGAWNVPAKMLRAAYRDNRKSTNRASNTKFACRCARFSAPWFHPVYTAHAASSPDWLRA